MLYSLAQVSRISTRIPARSGVLKGIMLVAAATACGAMRRSASAPGLLGNQSAEAKEPEYRYKPHYHDLDERVVITWNEIIDNFGADEKAFKEIFDSEIRDPLKYFRAKVARLEKAEKLTTFMRERWEGVKAMSEAGYIDLEGEFCDKLRKDFNGSKIDEVYKSTFYQQVKNWVGFLLALYRKKNTTHGKVKDDLKSWWANAKNRDDCQQILPKEKNKEKSRQLVKDKIANRLRNRTRGTRTASFDENEEVENLTTIQQCVKHKRFLWGYHSLFNNKADGFVSKGTPQPLTKNNVTRLVAALDFYCKNKDFIFKGTCNQYKWEKLERPSELGL